MNILTSMRPLNSVLVLAAVILAVFWQCAFHGLRQLLGAQIDLLPALVIYAALTTGLLTLTLVAVVGGLLFDSLSANPLGVTMLPLFVVGWLVYLKRDLILKDQAFAQMVLGLAASALAPVMVVLLLLTLGHAPLIGWGSIWQWTVMSVGGAVATPILFQLFGLLDQAFNYKRATETSFRADREIRRGRK